jgi:hypothetical protein
MNIVDALYKFLLKKNSEQEDSTPEEICPNCWGRQEYGGKFYESVKQANLDISHKDEALGWIADYANTHLKGIALQRKGDTEEIVCIGCKVSFHSK